MTPEQMAVGRIVVAALEGDGDELCRLINAVPKRKLRDASAKSVDLLADCFRQIINPADWQQIVAEARASLLLLDLDEPADLPPTARTPEETP